jgi:hypothetical protein
MQIFTILGIAESYIASVDAIFSPGQICPIFTITLLPSLPDLLGLSWPQAIDTMPSSITITLLDETWTCNLRRDDLKIGANDGMTRTLRYVPNIISLIAERKSYARDVYYYSVPDWIYGQLTEAIDTTNADLNFSSSDIYPTDGYTIDEIATHFLAYAGVTLNATIPTCHVQDQTVQYVAGSTTYLGFIQSLILSIPLEYVFFATDTELTVTTIEPEVGKSLDPVEYHQGSGISAGRDYLDAYASFRFTGGYSEPVLADYAYENLQTQLPDQTGTEFTVLDQEVGESITTHLTKTHQYDPFGKLFCILEKTEQIYGDVYDISGENPVQQFREEIETVYTYENQDSLLYEAPRLLGTTVNKSGYTYHYSAGFVNNSYGKAFYLTEDLEVMSYPQYLASGLAPTDILASGYIDWANLYHIETQEISYVTTDLVNDRFKRFEGMVITDNTATTVLGFSLTGDAVIDLGWFPCTSGPEQVFSQVVLKATAAGGITAITVEEESQVLEFSVKTYDPITDGMYEFTDMAGRYNVDTDKTETVSHSIRVGSDEVPASPSRPRRQQLIYKEGDFGSSGSMVATNFSIPTCNRSDFATIRELLKTQANNELEEETHTAIAITDFRFPGMLFGDKTVVGFSAREDRTSGYTLSITIK